MKLIYNNEVIADKIVKADTFFTRLIGLLNKDCLGSGEGLMLFNCSSVHCFFMKFTIDVVYLSKDMMILYKETIKPWIVGKIVKNCSHVLELPEGKAKNILVGDYIVLVE